MPVGGDILEINYNHPTIGSGVFYPKAGEDSTFDLGGFKGNDDANSIDGGGRNIRQLNRTRWSFEVSVSWDMNTENEMFKLQQLAESPQEADYTITSVNGTVWAGKGAPVGDQNGNGNTSVISLKIAGGDKLKKII